MPDPLFTDLLRDTERLTWASIDQVTHRGRQRARRTRMMSVLAAAVAVAVVATGAVVLSGSPEATAPMGPAGPAPTESTGPSAGPLRTVPTSPTGNRRPLVGAADPAVPAAAMLQEDDGPAGYQADDSEGNDDWAFTDSADRCVNPDHPLLRLVTRAERDRYLRDPEPRSNFVMQRVARLAVDDALRYQSLVLDRVESCGDKYVSMWVVAAGFAGEESLVVRAQHNAGPALFYVFVRQGDLVTQVWHNEITDTAAAVELGRAAARRLCAGTDTC
ncbi:hypothetical protein [Verrucosispora sp. TAA-831]|uniref:hypothetical protein n=1 Tax=Verrucosispora sp. TAA-831 TaxID=3422227 RepID=UPI003D6EA106